MKLKQLCHVYVAQYYYEEDTRKFDFDFCDKFLKFVMRNTCVILQKLLTTVPTLRLKLPRGTEKMVQKVGLKGLKVTKSVLEVGMHLLRCAQMLALCKYKKCKVYTKTSSNSSSKSPNLTLTTHKVRTIQIFRRQCT